VGTVDSGLNSVVLANNEETILLPINEPTYGTKRKSQIQTYLEQNKVVLCDPCPYQDFMDSLID
jgi:4-hydroxyphenylpyruvate dioxygenase